LQPVKLEPTGIGIGIDLMADKAWRHGPAKPRDVERSREVPPEPVDLASIANGDDSVEVLPEQTIGRISEVDRLPRDVSAFVVAGSNFGLLGELCKLGRPILPSWDSFGYAWSGRMIREVVDETDAVCFVPFDAEDVRRILRVLRAVTVLRNLRALYIGHIPSHSVRNASYDFDDMLQRLGVQFRQLSIEAFETVVEEADEDAAAQVADEWSQDADLLDGRDEKLAQYASIYLGLKKLLEDNDANAVTMDCAFLKSVELVPCYSFSRLIDEGIPAGCEADTSALISMAILMGLSGEAALMGNLFANATHDDVENNVIVINHDVVPPSMAGQGKHMRLRDFHAVGEGLTGFTELEEGSAVTVAGMDRKANRLWYTSGQVVWTEDTVHCRTSIGVKVDDAKRIGRESFGHHQALAYGNWTSEMEMLGRALRIEVRGLSEV
jgi:L-fucose isomerase-like protein